MKTKCHQIISEDSRKLQRYIHIYIYSYIHLYNSLRTLLKAPRFSAVFSLKTKLLCARETVTENCALCWTVFIYHELFKSR